MNVVYGYPYPVLYPMMSLDGQYADHGDGYGEYYGMSPMPMDEGPSTRQRPTHTSRHKSRSRSRGSQSRSHTRSHSHSHSTRSHSRSRSHTHSRSHSSSVSRRNLSLREPSLLDAFRVLYLTPSKHKKNESLYLATKKRQDRVQEYLKSDGLGSKRWLFYPRDRNRSEPTLSEVPAPAESRMTCDTRVKVDGNFFRKYKRSKKLDVDAPINKLKRWELLFYKKLGFIQAV